MWTAARDIMEQKGIAGFYCGFLIRALWSAAKISLQFFCYDRIKTGLYNAVLWGVM